MCSWVSSGPWHLGHLCDSIASGDIFDFWCPVFSHPCMLFKVLICFNGPTDKNPDLISLPIKTVPYGIVQLAALDLQSDLVKKVRRHLYLIHQDTYFHQIGKEFFLQRGFTSPSSINFLNFSANPLASQFIWPICRGPHMASCHLGGLSPIWVDAVESTPSLFPRSQSQYQCHRCIVVNMSFCVGFGLPVRLQLGCQHTSHTCSWTQSDGTSWSEIAAGSVLQFQIIQLVLN